MSDQGTGSLFASGERVYISGPISLDGRATPGEIEANMQAFHDYAARLTAAGCIPLSPLDNGLDPSSSWEDHMRADIGMLTEAHEIHMLPRWQESRGSTLEMFIATQIGVKVRTAL